MQRLGVSGAVRPIYGSLGVKTFKNKDELLVGILNKCLIQNLAIFKVLITICGRIAAQSEKGSRNTCQNL